jgi:hypothetical protein
MSPAVLFKPLSVALPWSEVPADLTDAVHVVSAEQKPLAQSSAEDPLLEPPPPHPAAVRTAPRRTRTRGTRSIGVSLYPAGAVRITLSGRNQEGLAE